MVKYSKEWLSHEEFQKMLSVPTLSERNEIILLLLYYPALRVSEMLHLKVADVDIATETLIIRGGKGHDETELQRVHCDVKIIRKVMHFIEHEGLKKKDYIIQSNKKKSMHRSQVYRLVNDIAKDAGIQRTIGTHTFRRSRATNLLDEELDVSLVSGVLRHKNIATTGTYLNLSVGRLQKKVKEIDTRVGIDV